MPLVNYVLITIEIRSELPLRRVYPRIFLSPNNSVGLAKGVLLRPSRFARRAPNNYAGAGGGGQVRPGPMAGGARRRAGRLENSCAPVKP